MDSWLGACVIIPNHVRGILVLVEAGFKPASTAIVRLGLPEIAQICSGIEISWNRCNAGPPRSMCQAGSAGSTEDSEAVTQVHCGQHVADVPARNIISRGTVFIREILQGYLKNGRSLDG